MKMWRERLLEAQQRGRLSFRDRALWLNLMRCPAAEAMRAAGFELKRDEIGSWDQRLWYLGTVAFLAANRGDFARAFELLDEIEDRALELKRGRPA